MNKSLTAAAVLLVAGAIGVQAQATSSSRIPIRKDQPTTTTTTTSNGNVATTPTTTDSTNWRWGWYTPTASSNCSSVDMTAAKAVSIKSDLYNSATMISPDSAKVVALCAVPGQIGSGEMESDGNGTHYAIDIIPNKKKTHTKVLVDAQTGAVLSSKQYGGLRGLAGWVRESAEHKTNAKKTP